MGLNETIIREIHQSQSDDKKIAEIVNKKIAEIIFSSIKQNGEQYDN